MTTMQFDIRDQNGNSWTASYPQPNDQTCGQCGREITPGINPPAPSQGRYNGFADCPKCGAILWSIAHDEFTVED